MGSTDSLYKKLFFFFYQLGEGISCPALHHPKSLWKPVKTFPLSSPPFIPTLSSDLCSAVAKQINREKSAVDQSSFSVLSHGESKRILKSTSPLAKHRLHTQKILPGAIHSSDQQYFFGYKTLTPCRRSFWQSTVTAERFIAGRLWWSGVGCFPSGCHWDSYSSPPNQKATGTAITSSFWDGWSVITEEKGGDWRFCGANLCVKGLGSSGFFSVRKPLVL